MISPTEIHTNDQLPDGVLVGLNAMGNVVVCLELNPIYNLIWQDPDRDSVGDVSEWHVSAAHRRRMISELAWRFSGFQCRGNA